MVLTDVVFWLVIVPFLSNTHLGLNTVKTFQPFSKILLLKQYHHQLNEFMVEQLMICMHTANAGFLLIETVLNSLVSKTEINQDKEIF